MVAFHKRRKGIPAHNARSAQHFRPGLDILKPYGSPDTGQIDRHFFSRKMIVTNRNLETAFSGFEIGCLKPVVG
ncbi:MAG: hypothetical protein IPL27_27040 [Lewinellaceae bacterium]|nr:hypothetical protein [Lewinellaceae bacterium]